MSRTQDLASFMTKIATDAGVADSNVISTIKAKLEKERSERIERAIMRIYREIEREVENIRQLRRQEQGTKARIASLEQQARDVLAGKVE